MPRGFGRPHLSGGVDFSPARATGLSAVGRPGAPSLSGGGRQPATPGDHAAGLAAAKTPSCLGRRMGQDSPVDAPREGCYDGCDAPWERSHPMTTRSVTVRVPATSANLGPGFDCLGLALDLWAE